MPTKNATNKVGDYSLQANFAGYNARQDPTTLSPNIMVAPSQNVLIGTSGRIALTKGYTIDGQSSSVIDSGILSNYDFDNFKGDRRNIRVGFLTTAGNDGKMQFRYVDVNGVVSWINIKTGLTTVHDCFCNFWDETTGIKYVLWVDGSNNIFAWNGAVTTFASATATTVTKQGTTTWAEEGFTATGSITIGGVTATYSGGSTSTTLTGVSVDFSATSVGAEMHQTPLTTALSAMTGIIATFGPTVIGCGRLNQIYLGASNSNQLYISKRADYTNYSFSTPVRTSGEGNLLPLDAPPTKFVAQENKDDTFSYDMWISCGLNDWGLIRTKETIGYDSSGVATTASETMDYIRMNTAPLLGARSERLCTKMKNNIMFVANDSVANFFGYFSYKYVPAMTDFSYPIIDDMNSYDFTDASIFYHKNYVYIAVPKHSLIRVYNMTDQTKEQYSNYSPIEQVDNQPWFWETPITFPLSGFYVVNGELYGHNYTTSESYKLFDGGSLNGQEIDANATFAFDGKEDRTQSKGSNELWIEGYIKQNTLLNATISGDLDACQSSQTVVVDGSDIKIVCYGNGAHSLGKNNLGTQPLGGSNTLSGPLPAWFHVSKTYPQVPFYLEQLSFESKGVDLQWELITFGTNARMTPEGNNSITE